MQNKPSAYVVLLSNPQELIADERFITSVDKVYEKEVRHIFSPSFIKVGKIYGVPIYQVDPEKLRHLTKRAAGVCHLCGTKYVLHAQYCHQCGTRR